MTAVTQLGAGAVLEYQETGWTITPGGRVDSGTVTGPCAKCRRPCVRYGSHGKAWCGDCRATKAAPSNSPEPPTTRSIA